MEVHLPSQGRTQGQSWKKQKEERAHLEKKRAEAGTMSYVYSAREKQREARLEQSRPREAERAATAAALRAQARTPYRCILRWAQNAHLKKGDAGVVNR